MERNYPLVVFFGGDTNDIYGYIWECVDLWLTLCLALEASGQTETVSVRFWPKMFRFSFILAFSAIFGCFGHHFYSHVGPVQHELKEVL